MLRIINLLLISSLLISLFAQPRSRPERKPQIGPKPIYLESHVVPHDSVKLCYISYRVPYSNLVFVRQGNSFTGGITLRVEVTSEEGVETRESSSDNVFVASYEKTIDNKTYLEGILKFELKKSLLTINPLVEIHNTDSHIPLKPFNVNGNTIDYVVAQEKMNCGDEEGFKLVNYENSIPFSDNDYNLLIPIYDADIQQINVEIEQEGNQIISKNLTPSLNFDIDYKKCNDNILLVNKSDGGITANVFKLSAFSYKLAEGTAKLLVEDETGKVLLNKEIEIIWTEKPRSLFRPKYAYELLDIVESEDKLDAIYDEADGEYEVALNLFWDRYDPNKETPYNQLMYEFYSRADEALRKYVSTGDRFGSITDRGKIFIKFGEPGEVNRFYTEKNEIAEIWKYKKPEMEFVFVDASGLGNYKLVN